MEQLLTEGKLTELNAAHGVLTDLSFNEARHDRWSHLFEPDEKVKPHIREMLDMSKDPVLEHYGVPAKERARRRMVTELLLDNMLGQIQSQKNGLGILQETTTTSNIATFTKWALPLVRKYMPRNFLWEIVPTYPMNQSTGKLHTADTTYGSSGGTYASGTSIYASFDSAYAADPGECGTTKELNFKITSANISAISKKLRGVWSIEAQQDTAADHGLALEQEIVRMLGVQINREINRYGINQLVSNAATTTNWNSSQPMASTNGWSNATPRQYAESIWDSVVDANKAIKDAQYVNANFILCGTDFAARLAKLRGFSYATTPDNAVEGQVTEGPNLFGTLGGRYKVYEDVDFPADKALIGHKPSQWQYTGAAFLPYVPVWMTPTVHSATTLCPARGYLSRFAFQVVNANFYGMIVVY